VTRPEGATLPAFRYGCTAGLKVAQQAREDLFLELCQKFLYNGTIRKHTTEHIVKEPDVNSSNLYILIAEDEPSHAVVIRRTLEREYPAARIEVVTSIHEYRERIAASTPSIALVDLNLSDGSALELLTDSAAAPAFPVVIMSSYASKQVAINAVKAGAMELVIKSPELFFSLARLVEKTVRAWELRLKENPASPTPQ